MNKKELSDLKKNFSSECGFFAFNQILSAFIDADKNILFSDHRLFGTLEADDTELVEAALRKGLSGTLGKNIIEYPFPKTAYEEGMPQKVLMKALNDKFLTDELNEAFLKHIAGKIDYKSTFALFAVHCTYTLFKRDKNDEKTENNSDYNFILTVFCPVTVDESILVYDDELKKIHKRLKNDRLISRAPLDAFLFPVLTGGEPDVNSVLYYTAKPKEPNSSIIEDILGCKAAFTPEGEKEAFGKALGRAAGEELDYTLITRVNELITEEIKEHRFDEKPAVIDDIKFRDILYEAGVSREKAQKAKEVFTDTVGSRPLTASNLVAAKTVVSMPDITVNIGKNAKEKVRVSVIGGRRCLVIDVDDPNIVINGMNTTVEFPQGGGENAGGGSSSGQDTEDAGGSEDIDI